MSREVPVQGGQKALFTIDTRFAVFMSGAGSEPTYIMEGREALTQVFADLNQYEVTTHFNGQSTVHLDGDRPTGESYTLAHHLSMLKARGRSRSRRFATWTSSLSSTEPGTSPSAV